MFRELFEMFRKPSAAVLAQRELEEAQRELLAAHSAQEYARRMADYHSDRIKRLSTYVVAQGVLS